MEFIKPAAELWEQGYTINDIWKHIARCTRVCYQSTPKNDNETEEAFVKRVLFRDDEHWNSVRNHLAMLEHGTVYLAGCAPSYFIAKYVNNKYSFVDSSESPQGINNHGETVYLFYITTNLRVIVENGWMDDIKLYWSEPCQWHKKRYTISFITNLGVSREFNRHRVNSIAEESTRYCNYSKDKFGNEVTFTVPAWYAGPVGHVVGITGNKLSTETEEYMLSSVEELYFRGLLDAEDNYLCLLKKGWIPQQAREILPLATKTQLVHTAFEDDWKHFIALRSEGVSGAPHPNAKILGDMVKELLNGKTI